MIDRDKIKTFLSEKLADQIEKTPQEAFDIIDYKAILLFDIIHQGKSSRMYYNIKTGNFSTDPSDVAEKEEFLSLSPNYIYYDEEKEGLYAIYSYYSFEDKKTKNVVLIEDDMIYFLEIGCSIHYFVPCKTGIPTKEDFDNIQIEKKAIFLNKGFAYNIKNKEFIFIKINEEFCDEDFENPQEIFLNYTFIEKPVKAGSPEYYSFVSELKIVINDITHNQMEFYVPKEYLLEIKKWTADLSLEETIVRNIKIQKRSIKNMKKKRFHALLKEQINLFCDLKEIRRIFFEYNSYSLSPNDNNSSTNIKNSSLYYNKYGYFKLLKSGEVLLVIAYIQKDNIYLDDYIVFKREFIKRGQKFLSIENFTKNFIFINSYKEISDIFNKSNLENTVKDSMLNVINNNYGNFCERNINEICLLARYPFIAEHFFDENKRIYKESIHSIIRNDNISDAKNKTPDRTDILEYKINFLELSSYTGKDNKVYNSLEDVFELSSKEIKYFFVSNDNITTELIRKIKGLSNFYFDSDCESIYSQIEKFVKDITKDDKLILHYTNLLCDFLIEINAKIITPIDGLIEYGYSCFEYQGISLMDWISTFKSYIEFALIEGYDLDDKNILFPKNLKLQRRIVKAKIKS